MFLALNPKHSQPNPCRERPNKPPSSTMKLRANRTPRTCSINWSALAQAGNSTVPLIRISCGVLLTKLFYYMHSVMQKMQPCHWLSRSARRFSISLGFRLQAAVKGTKASNPTEHPTFPPKKKTSWRVSTPIFWTHVVDQAMRFVMRENSRKQNSIQHGFKNKHAQLHPRPCPSRPFWQRNYPWEP